MQTKPAAPVTASKDLSVGALIPRTAVWSGSSDFWMLGGMSILFCAIMHLVNLLKDDVHVFQMRFLQVGTLLSLLSIVCNHPHFMISYRFGYGRGTRFILQNWFSLIAIPTLMIVGYSVAFLNYHTDISGFANSISINRFFEFLGMTFTVGSSGKLGEEILGLSIWVMYLSVGWHYSKQTYGCMMVYAFYNGYRLSPWQKSMFKWGTMALAVFQFVWMARSVEQYSAAGGSPDSRFQGIHLSTLGLPQWMASASLTVMACFAILAIGIILSIYKNSKKWPPIQFVTTWLALYIWWVPLTQLPEYYILMVPFFHSLQYLPFALRLESAKIKKNRWFYLQSSIRLLILVAVGFGIFDLIPSLLDSSLQTESHQTAWFFSTSFIIFINIHHFFIDSVVWKFNDAEVRNGLLFKT